MPIQTIDEAMTLFDLHRGDLVAHARREAAILCLKKGSTHSREVRAAMEAKGLIPDPTINDRWLGSVFRCQLFEPTGETVKIEDRERNIHRGHTRNVWQLRPEYRHLSSGEHIHS